jgi:carboxyl-terminal processing protease
MRDIMGSNYAFAAPLSQSGQGGYPLLDEVQVLIDNHYLREQPDNVTREYAAIRGMMASLEDRYTFFIEPPIAQSESDVLAGTYGGIGVQVSRNEDGVFVLYPFPDSPAEQAGIEEGDILVAINGETVDSGTQQDVVDQKMRGEVKEGSGVELTVRKADEEDFTVFIAFDVINVPSVIWRVLAEDEQIGYVQILRFTSRTPEELKEALGELNSAEIEALVVDMRNNSGGLLKESIDVASEFLGRDLVVLRESRRGSEEVFEANGDGLAIEIPLAVLINQGTASAAELVAGAIQDHDRGILIGQTTYGKGTVQQIFRLSDNSSLHITSAEWLTPNGNTLEGVGLQPDIAMIPDANGRDVELGEAIRELQQLK